MSPRTLLIVVALVVATAGCWGLTHGSSSVPSNHNTLEGQALVPGLDQMEEITRLAITRGVDTATVDLEDGVWRCDDGAGGFPLDPTKISDLVRTVARFTSDQLRTGTASHHKIVNLNWPDPSGKARRLTVYAGQDIAADLILGKYREAPEPSTYVRLAGSDQTYLCRGSVRGDTDVPTWIPDAAPRILEDEIAWIMHDGVKLEPDDTVLSESATTDSDSQEADQAESDQVDSVENHDPPPSPEPAWSVTLMDPELADRWTEKERSEARNILPSWMTTLNVEKVEPWTPRPSDALDDIHITYGLKSGGAIEVTSYRDDDDKRWIRLLAVDGQTVEATSDVAAAASAHARTGAYAMRVPFFSFYGLDKLVQIPDELAEPEESGDGEGQ